MSGRWLGVMLVLASCAPTTPGRVLRVCADPNNLPFSDSSQRGFENRIADLLARELGARLEYTWWAQRRSFFRSTLGAGRCDLVMGVPAGFERALTTRPYYRSSYVFVTRANRELELSSLDDARLGPLTLGVQLIGDDGVNAPPAQALARRGLTQHVVGFTVYGDYTKPSPPSNILRALEAGELDVALVWGPLAGAYARTAAQPLSLAAITREPEDPPFAFDIALGVGRGQKALRDELQRVVDAHQPEVDLILREAGVPLLPLESATAYRGSR